MPQRLIPGLGYVDESSSRQGLIPGIGYVDESVTVGGSSPTYTLTLGAGTFAVAGQSIGLKAGRVLAIGAGVFALAGQALGLRAGRVISLNAGTFALTGQTVALIYTPITTGGGPTYTISLGAGTFTLSGKAVNLLAQRRWSLGTGSFALAGQSLQLTPQGTPPDARYARPKTDISAGPWTASNGGTLAAAIDEASADDSDYIQTSAPGACEIKLNAVTDPGTSAGQVVRYRTWSDYGNGVTVQLRQGATVIAQWVHDSLPTVPTTFERALTAAQCDAISDYADLRFEFIAP